MEKKKIVVTGDICVHSLICKGEIKNEINLSYEKFPAVKVVRTIGGALLLEKLVKLSTENSTIYTPRVSNLEDSLKNNVLTSLAEVDKFYISNSQKSKGKVYRIKDFFGYSINNEDTRKFSKVTDEPDSPDLVILDDENNGFNSHKEVWPESVLNGKPEIVYKTSDISRTNPLFRHIFKNHLDNTIMVINCDDLRNNGINISRGLSWEKTATDFIWQMKNNSKLVQLSRFKNLIITLGVEGVIHYSSGGTPKLYFLTSRFEGEFLNDSKGKMYGVTSCFVAGLAKALLNQTGDDKKNDLIHQGIKEGIVASHKYYRDGFGIDFEIKQFPNTRLFNEKMDDFIIKEHIQDVYIKDTSSVYCKGCWSIIKDKSSANLQEIASSIVTNGSEKALEFIPTAKFRNLKTVDREEIEAYKGIQNLISEYLSNQNTVRPLSIAVFGTPGSGKSFGVTEVASSIAPNLIKKLDFNLSQFQEPKDLISALHKVRDVVLEQKIPLVFFDEFDSAFNGKLGWLKYFLAPMQDGLFRDGDSLHPIGKAVFVFAGGTSNTYEDFCGNNLNSDKSEDFVTLFKEAKGPDFVSRLRGFIDILGPNPSATQNTNLFIIRRAMLLRSLLERKASHLINNNKEAQVDEGIIQAMLRVPFYKHGSRSMEAIFDMSTISHGTSWEQSDLPPKSHLNLHVDEEEFYRLLMKNEFLTEKLELVTRDIYNKYRTFYTNCSKTYIDSWNDISNRDQKSLRVQIKQITNSLRRINVEVYATSEKPETFNFTPSEMKILLEVTHENIVLQKKRNGWIYGETFDEADKRDPLLTSYVELSSKSKSILSEYIKQWPHIFADSYLKLERFSHSCFCDEAIKKAQARAKTK